LIKYELYLPTHWILPVEVEAIKLELLDEVDHKVSLGKIRLVNLG
jgi:hypothetical protein